MKVPQLTPRWRKLMLVLHILGGVGWMGLDVGLVALAFTAATTASASAAAGSYAALGMIIPLGVLPLSLVMLITGVLLGVATKWGLIRYWWVAVKLAVGLILTALVLAVLLPAAGGLGPAGSYPDGAAVRAALGPVATQIVFPPLVSFAALGFALILSVFKPWGRIAKRLKHHARTPSKGYPRAENG